MATSLENGIAAAKAGNKQLAMQYLKQAVTEDPRNVVAWLWVSSLVENPERKIFCFQKVLEIDPNNKYALQGMNSLSKPNTSTVQRTTTSPQYQTAQPQKTVIDSQPKRQVAQTPLRKSIPTKKPSKNISVGYVFKTFGKLILGFIALSFLPLIYMDVQSIGDFALRTFVAFWAISGYYGAWLLIRKGHAAGLGGCTILLGGAPLLLPLFLGPFLLIWGKSAKDKHAAPEAYLVCPSCQQPTSMKLAFCSNCGNPIPQVKHR